MSDENDRRMRMLIRDELRRWGLGARRGPLLGHEVSNGVPYAEVKGFPGAATDEQLQAAVLEPFGHASRPPVDVVALVLRTGGQHVVVAVEDGANRPTLAEGESALYNAHAALVLLNKDGEIVLNGGGAEVGRVGDAVTAGSSMASWISSVSSALGIGGPSDFGTISEGAEKVKA